MLKQNRFISIISIAGTALAIMMIMTIVVIHGMKTLSVDPEPHRNRSLYIEYYALRNKERQSVNMNPLTEGRVQDLSSLETPEMLSFFTPFYADDTTPVQAEGSNDFHLVYRRGTDDRYWKLFSFGFLEGRPYTYEEFHSGVPVTVLTESLAKKLYGNASAVGKTIVSEFKPYRVIGVVRDVSRVFSNAFGDFWVPYTTDDSGYKVAILAKNREDFPAIIEEVRQREEKFNVERAPEELRYTGPFTQQQQRVELSYIDEEGNEKAIKAFNRKQVFILLVLLLIPALNLSGFSLSRVKKRMSEIGIRKAFGAKKVTILTQILYENLITSLIGGLIGLGLSYLVLLNFRHWLLGVPPGEAVPLSVLVSPITWLAVFLVCFLMNLLSAGLPAWRAARMTIIHSINQNEKSL